MMRGHLHIHLGPPKTATTSLQLGLQAFSHPEFIYFGVPQPRPAEPSNRTNVLHSYASGDLNATSPEVGDVLEEIRSYIRDGKTVFISEEMFLVWQKSASFWDKIRRLDALISDIPHSYAITLRDPAETLPSYYQELHNTLSLQEKQDESLFFMHERCDCYDYAKIVDVIGSLGQEVAAWDFHLISQDALCVSSLLGPQTRVTGTIKIPKENIGKKTSSKARELSPLTVSDVANVGPLRMVKTFMKTRAPVIFSRVRRLLKTVTLAKGHKRAVTVPEARLSQLQLSYQATKAAFKEANRG